ncbi:RND family efflux transporter, MFP subunit [Terriglobus roseus DSM 18391]|uniref:RND family efflux transporter, MFP subunit n=1 Tax=Terriglobus roseus (strain DSM 18391 / NRRL B-41598 / KBS 63) TaxID=926566 RepID=I3ZE75_TERRK|nr:efflux RND transporter periplasmic adaptor subunit [Terriglobus roseus]AFL87543.1 RND family efflux transporter, MFP subunit [Terriglobus roseus DSM 18391]
MEILRIESAARAKPVLSVRSGHLLLWSLVALACLQGCRRDETKREAAEAPPSTPQVVEAGTSNTVHVDQAKLFPMVAADQRSVFDTLNVTGAVQPDVSREVPVLSIANGRVTALHVGLGDTVRKGQLVMEVQSPDVAQAFMSYRTALANEQLAKTTLTRDQLLFDKGAIARSQLDVADNAETDARAALRAAEQELRILGVDKDHPSDSVRVYAPISGIVVAQNTTAAGAAGINFAGAAGSFTIADLSHVWVVCDVYENDLASVHLGESAEIRLSAFPDKVRIGTISDIGSILDPSIRTAKVRIQVQNPDNLLRIGMFATATFRGVKAHNAVTVPGTAILHLHDHDFVYMSTATAGSYRRVPVQEGHTLPGGAVEIPSGLSAGQQVVANALELQNTAGQ